MTIIRSFNDQYGITFYIKAVDLKGGSIKRVNNDLTEIETLQVNNTTTGMMSAPGNSGREALNYLDSGSMASIVLGFEHPDAHFNSSKGDATVNVYAVPSTFTGTPDFSPSGLTPCVVTFTVERCCRYLFSARRYKYGN